MTLAGSPLETLSHVPVIVRHHLVILGRLW